MGRLKSLDDWLNWQENLHLKEIDLGLERIKKVYAKLFPSGVPFKVITVAGTNGKGSTVSFIHSIYQQSAVKSAKFTSPHLLKYNERFVINGEQATDTQIINAFSQIERVRGNISLTYFEFSTLAALLIFALEKVDVAVLEVGLGGRLDSVNVLDNDVSVITNIAIDHVDYLGDTRELIGAEKAGIMRKNTACVCGDTDPPLVLQQCADVLGATLEFIVEPYHGKINLAGKHQRYNAALAIRAVEKLSEILPINPLQIEAGISNTMLVARFQIKHINNKIMILDVAHNAAAALALSTELAKETMPTIAIFSALQGKNIRAMVNVMRPLIGKWLLLELGVNRAIDMQTLCQQFDLSDNVHACDNMQNALHQGLNNSQYQRIVVFGSFHVVSQAIKTINIP